MGNPERRHPMQEIGKSEKTTFRNKAVELMRNPQSTESASGPVPVVNTFYERGNDVVQIDMPEPGYVSAVVGDPLNTVTIRWDTYTGTNNEGNRVYLRKNHSLNLSTNKTEYEEKTIERDVTGERVRSAAEQKMIDLLFGENADMASALKEMSSRIQVSDILGNVFTQKRFTELMTFLDTLTPEDEL